MTTPAAAAPISQTAHHWNRWSVCFALTGLAALVPSFVLPAMLVANALEGPRLFSVITGIRELWRNEHQFLAGLILVFSVCFPIIKLLISLLCASGATWMSRRARVVLVWLASWTAKYSMLDVLVVAVLVMTVKVGDYVHVEANQGIYLFCFAIVCSAIAGALLEMALRREHRAPAVTWRRWKLHALLVLAGGTLAWGGWQRSRVESGGMVEKIHMQRLTKRGALKRSIESTLANDSKMDRYRAFLEGLKKGAELKVDESALAGIVVDPRAPMVPSGTTGGFVPPPAPPEKSDH